LSFDNDREAALAPHQDELDQPCLARTVIFEHFHLKEQRQFDYELGDFETLDNEN